MAKKQKDNVEFVKDMMNVSKFGALVQPFVLIAIEKYAEAIANTPLDDLRKQMEFDIVHPDSWHGIAKEIVDKFAERRHEDYEATRK